MESDQPVCILFGMVAGSAGDYGRQEQVMDVMFEDFIKSADSAETVAMV